MTTKTPRGLGLALIFILATGVLFAQSQATTGTIQGTIQDPSGAAVPNAKVVVKNVDTGNERTVTSDGEGRFLVPLLGVGNYESRYQPKALPPRSTRVTC